MIILDWTTTILQSSIFSYALSYCISKKQNTNKVILLFMTAIFSFMGITAGTFHDNLGLAIFLNHVLALLVVMLIYKKNLIDGLIVYTIIYSIIGINSIIFENIVFAYVKEILLIEYVKYAEIFIIHGTQIIAIYLCFKYINTIKQLYKVILNRGIFIYELILSFSIDFLTNFCLLSFGYNSQIAKNIIYVMFFIFFIVILFYFWKISYKSTIILKLNESLEIKNNELRKIKHDYGAQISYLYGLCLMKRYPDLKKSLKDIIEVNETIPTGAEVIQAKNSILSLALKPAINAGIHVILEDTCDYSLVTIKEIELYRIVSNIVSNAITAMKGEGIIIVRSYETLGNIIIDIENNGPKIEADNVERIFKAGFTTKINSDNSHGYGLSIVKDIVESYSGKISVRSTETVTQFKISLPIE